MTDRWQALVRRLESLEETLPYVTVDQLCDPRCDPHRTVDEHGDPRHAEPALTPPTVAEVEGAIADGRLFTDRRQQLAAATGAVTAVRLVRLNRRHPAVAAVLDASN